LLLGWRMPSPSGGRLGWGQAQFAKPAGNSLQGRFQMNERRIGCKTPHLETLRPEKGIAPSVVALSLLMLGTGQFNNQPGRQACEISHIVAQWMLATELRPQLLAAQAAPELALRIGHLAAQH